MRCHTVRAKAAKASASPTGSSGAGIDGRGSFSPGPGYSLRPRVIPREELG